MEKHLKIPDLIIKEKIISSEPPPMKIEEKIENSPYIPQNIWDLLKDE